MQSYHSTDRVSSFDVESAPGSSTYGDSRSKTERDCSTGWGKKGKLGLALVSVLLVVSLAMVASTNFKHTSSQTGIRAEIEAAKVAKEEAPTGNTKKNVHWSVRPKVDGFTMLSQSDFADGTVRLTTEGGKYKLAGDIIFEPNPSGKQGNAQGAFLPDFATQSATYPPQKYVLGFFSAITIEAKDITLDLGGHTIAMSKTFYYMQRVYAHITIADSPFIENHGPANFGPLTGAMNCVIRNGVLARSSHHGIHGNAADDCKIKNVKIVDFEIAGIALNNVQKITIVDVDVGPALRPEICSPIFNGRMLLEFFRNSVDAATSASEKQRIEDTVVKFSGRPDTTAKDVFGKLEAALDLTLDFFVNHNSLARQDPKYDPQFDCNGQQHGSSSYGIVIHGAGPSVTGIGFSDTGASSDIVLKRVTVQGVHTQTVEVVAFLENEANVDKMSVGPTGDLVDVLRWSDHQDGSTQEVGDLKYVGNSRADALFAMEELRRNGDAVIPEGSPLAVTDMIRNWVRDGTPIVNSEFFCNGDSQFHVIKGVFGIRIEDTVGFTLRDVTVKDVENFGPLGSRLCGEYTVSHPDSADTLGYGGTAAYGISITKSSGKIVNTRVENVRSLNGVAFGVVVWDDSEVQFRNGQNGNKRTIVTNIEALGGEEGPFELGDTPPARDPAVTRLPNRFPEACGLDVRNGGVTINGQQQSFQAKCLTSRLVCKTGSQQFGVNNPLCGMASASSGSSAGASGGTSGASPAKLLRKRIKFEDLTQVDLD